MHDASQVAKALVMTEKQYTSVKLTVLLCLYLTYLLSRAKVRSPSLSNLSSQ